MQQLNRSYRSYPTYKTYSLFSAAKLNEQLNRLITQLDFVSLGSVCRWFCSAALFPRAVNYRRV
jgi:hypothetical protein